MYNWNFQSMHIRIWILNISQEQQSCKSRIICESCLGNVQETNSLFQRDLQLWRHNISLKPLQYIICKALLVVDSTFESISGSHYNSREAYMHICKSELKIIIWKLIHGRAEHVSLDKLVWLNGCRYFWKCKGLWSVGTASGYYIPTWKQWQFAPPWFLSARSFDQLQKCLLAIELVSGCTASAAADGSPGRRAPPEQCDLPQPWMLALLWMLLQVSSVWRSCENL